MQFLGTDSPQTKAWTSLPANVNTADTIQGSAFSDQAGTLKVQQSGDGTNWDFEDDIAVSASTGAKINLPLLNPYVRLVWTSSVDPTVFRVYGRLSSSGAQP